MDEHVASGPQPSERQVLALEVGGVVVAVADRDALADSGHPGPVEAAAARVDRLRGARGQLARGRDLVAVAEAEAGLAIAHDGAAAEAAQLIAVEPQQMPVPVV